MHDLVTKFGVIVHETFDLLRPLVLDISLAPSIFWESGTVIHILTELSKSSQIDSVIRVEPKDLTFTSRECMTLLLHDTR